MIRFVEKVCKEAMKLSHVGACVDEEDQPTNVFFSSTDFAVFSTPYHLFSTLSNFSLYPLRHFSRPYSTPIGARSLLCRYKHSLGLYKRPLQPAHQPTHPALPPPGLPNPHPAPPCPQPQQPTLHYQPLHFSIWTHPARPNKKQVWASSLYTL